MVCSVKDLYFEQLGLSLSHTHTLEIIKECMNKAIKEWTMTYFSIDRKKGFSLVKKWETKKGFSISRKKCERDWNLELAYSKSFPVAEKTMRPISASQRVESSKAFLKSPFLLFENATSLAVVLSIFLIWILLRVIFPDNSLSDPLLQSSNQIISPTLYSRNRNFLHTKLREREKKIR